MHHLHINLLTLLCHAHKSIIAKRHCSVVFIGK
uniref:Uncharacterized protein n=1 Tax=Anguilla anguilla TaxID=7936 RepID=A0A0E9T5N2_ANGAN